MERQSIDIEDQATVKLFEFVFKNAFGLPITFQSAPTLATMKSNTWGIYGTDLYIKFPNNSAIKITGAAVS